MKHNPGTEANQDHRYGVQYDMKPEVSPVISIRHINIAIDPGKERNGGYKDS